MNSNKIGIIIQARQTSTRFPGKSLALLFGKPIIEWVVERARKVSEDILVIVVIPDNERNEELNQKLLSLNVLIVRGSENNVASRFITAIKKFELHHVIRVCADNPLVSPRYIRYLIKFHLENDRKYSFNHVPKFGVIIPDGLGAEMFNANDFILSYETFSKKEEFEHVTLVMSRDSNVSDLAYEDWMKGTLKLDVDTKEDLENLTKLLSDYDLNELG